MPTTSSTPGRRGGAAAVTEPVVKAEHFGSLAVQLGERGICFASTVDDEDVEEMIRAAGADSDKPVPFMNDGIRCTVHPDDLPLAELRAIAGDAHHAQDEDDSVSWDHELPLDAYSEQWRPMWADDESHGEGQELVLVCQTDTTPLAGYTVVGVTASLTHGERSLDLRFDLHLVYVLPALRGQGYGLAMAATCGAMLSDVMQACRAAVPKSWTVNTVVHSDFVSFGGERNVLYIQALLKESERRIARIPGAKLKVAPPDAGF